MFHYVGAGKKSTLYPIDAITEQVQILSSQLRRKASDLINSLTLYAIMLHSPHNRLHQVDVKPNTEAKRSFATHAEEEVQLTHN